MFTIYRNELKMGLKTLLIWCMSIGFMGFICILLFSSLEEGMGDLAESFSNMGVFSEAFGISKLNMGTIAGYYATEIGTIHSLGTAMFSAMIATIILSKEEDGHTGEFLFAMPVSRIKIVFAKLMTIVSEIIILNIGCVVCYLVGLKILGEYPDWETLATYHLLVLLMNLEIAAICFLLSAFFQKNKFGVGLGIALMAYGYDVTARTVPDLKDYIGVGPFSYANAADLFGGDGVAKLPAIGAVIVVICCILVAHYVFNRRDLAA